MGCTNCKKKHTRNINQSSKIKNVAKQTIKVKKHNIIDGDRVVTWIIIVWFLLGCYGIYSIIKNIIELL